MVDLKNKHQIQYQMQSLFQELEVMDITRATIWNEIFDLKKKLRVNIDAVNLFNLQQQQQEPNLFNFQQGKST